MGKILKKARLSIRNKRACMNRLIRVEEAKVACQKRSEWRFAISAYPFGRCIHNHMLMIYIYIIAGATSLSMNICTCVHGHTKITALQNRYSYNIDLLQILLVG